MKYRSPSPRRPSVPRSRPTHAMGLRDLPEEGTRFAPAKNQGYQIPLPLWQELVSEAARRKRLGLPYPSQNAIAVVGITEWLQKHKGEIFEWES